MPSSQTQVSPQRLPAQTPGAGAPASGWAAANESLVVAVLLSVSAGCCNGFCYVGHGHLFASFMTGNLILLSVSLVQGNAVSGYLYPIGAFIIGGVLANVLGRKSVGRWLPFTPQIMTLLIEVVVLTALAFRQRPLADHFIVAAVTVMVAMQNVAFRQLRGRTYNSIFMTGNMQTFSNALARAVYPSDGAAWGQVRDFGAVLLAFAVGAAAGGFTVLHLGDRTALLSATAIAVALVVLIAAGLRGRTSES